MRTKLVAPLVVAATLAVHAAEVLRPAIGEPLRDAAVVRGPDGTWYLTGTRATGSGWEINPKAAPLSPAHERYVRSKPILRTRPDGSPDFLNNDGVRVWSSKDLKTWKDEGLVFDLMSFIGWNCWRARRWAHPDRPVGETPRRAVTSPRLFFHRGAWFLSYSMSGLDFGLSKASSPSGPFQPHHKQPDNRKKEERSSVGPGHGALFADADGSVYKIWGPGWAQRLKADLSNPEDGAAILDLLAAVEGYPNAEWCAAQFAPRAFSVHRTGDTYLLIWSATTDVDGYKREDSFVAKGKAFAGPYSAPQRLVAGSGPVTLFEGPTGLMLSCSMGDAPALIPLAWDGRRITAQGVEPPVKKKPELPGKLAMFDYANSKPSGTWHEPHPKTGRSRLVPLFDLPLADACIIKGGDDAYYLTGTAASKKAGTSPNDPLNPDFENNDGIYLWRSTDLNTWLPLGKVWDIERDAKQSPKSAWQLEHRIPANEPTSTRFARGITAPDIRFADGTYWIAYSMNGRGTGLLKSKTGKAEGPYEDLGRLTAMGGSPSLFVDEKGTAYWFWGDLRAAKLAATRERLDGVAVSLFSSLRTLHTHAAAGNLELLDWWDPAGPRLEVARCPQDAAPRYYLTWSAITQRHGRALRETMVARAAGDSPFGPYDKVELMIPHGGETSMFAGPDGKLYASWYGADPMAAFRNRPAIAPLTFGPWPRPAELPTKVTHNYYTNRGGWEALEPAVPKGLIDYVLTYLPDGYFYVSGSHQHRGEVRGKMPLWRSRDPLAPNWEQLLVWTKEECENDPDWPVYENPEEREKHWGKNDKTGIPWIGRLWHVGGDYVLNGFFTGLKNNKRMDSMLLKSVSGKPQGPYRFFRNTQIEDLLVDDDGTYYAIPTAAISLICRLTDLRYDKKDIFQLRVDDNTELANDCGCTLFKADGKYLWMGLSCYGCYDQQWYASDRIDGVYRLVADLPYTGNGNLVRGPDGRVYTSNQSIDYNCPAPGAYIYPVHVDLKSNPPIIEHQFEHEAGVRRMSVYDR